MATGIQKAVRRAILTALKADATLIALVPAARINPDGEPVWPFIRLRAPVTRPRRMTGSIAGDVAFDIHAFAGPRVSTGQIVETAEDHAGSIGAAIEGVLHDTRLALLSGEVRLRLSDIRLMEDRDADSYHWFAQVNARVLAA